ncbi:MAG: glycosyltransferase, partial [Flavobacteriales bacterium]
MIKLSVAIITYNEEQRVGACIDSVQDIADDIVIVDSYSNDNTEKICRERGVNFIKHEFKGHIQQKNYALSQAKFDRILSLDAYEVP